MIKIRGLLIITVLLLFVGVTNAQQDFRSGYIITLEDDTIYGEIDYRGDMLMCKVCKFKADNDSVLEYFPGEIIGYRFTDSKYYISKEIDGKSVFLEYLINGIVSFYYLKDGDGDHYYINKSGLGIREIPYKEGIRTKDGKQYIYESKKHIGFLNVYMQDAPNFQSRIAQIKKPDHRNLIRLAEDYHDIACDGDKCIIYEKKSPLIKINLEAVTGFVNFKEYENIQDKNYFYGGILFHLWMPRTNEKVYLTTGILYSQYTDLSENKYNYYSIPLQIGYMAPNTFRFRPFASIGILSPSYSAGMVVRVNKRINLGLRSMVNFSFDKVIWIPSELFSYSVLASIYIDFL